MIFLYPKAGRKDLFLQSRIYEELREQWGDRAESLGVTVRGGIATIHGQSRSPLSQEEIRRALAPLQGLTDIEFED